MTLDTGSRDYMFECDIWLNQRMLIVRINTRTLMGVVESID